MWSWFPNGNLGTSKGLLDHTLAAAPAPSSSLPSCPRYLGQAGSEENTLKEFPHPSQELIHIRPLEHIHLRKSREACWRQPDEGKASQHQSVSSLHKRHQVVSDRTLFRHPNGSLRGCLAGSLLPRRLSSPPHQAASGSAVPASTQLRKKCVHLCPGAHSALFPTANHQLPPETSNQE